MLATETQEQFEQPTKGRDRLDNHWSAAGFQKTRACGCTSGLIAITRPEREGSEMMDLEDRLRRLELEIIRARRLSRLMSIFLVTVIAVGGIAQAGLMATQRQGAVPMELRAKAIILEDASGRERAALRMQSTGPVLVLSGEEGAPQVMLTTSADSAGGPSLMLTDSKGMRSISLHLTHAGSGVFIDDTAGRPRAVLAVTSDGPSLHLFDDNRALRAIIGAGQTTLEDGRLAKLPESSLLLLGPTGKPLWASPR